MIINDWGFIQGKFQEYNEIQKEETQTRLLLEKDYFLQNIDPKEYAVHLGVKLINEKIRTNIDEYARNLISDYGIRRNKDIVFKIGMDELEKKDYSFEFNLNLQRDVSISFLVQNQKYEIIFDKNINKFERLIKFFIKPIVINQSLNSFDFQDIYLNFAKDKHEILELKDLIKNFWLVNGSWKTPIEFNQDIIYQGLKNLQNKFIRNFFTLNKEGIEFNLSRSTQPNNETQKLNIKVFIKNAFTLYPQMLYTNIIDEKLERPLKVNMEWGNIQLPDINARNNYFQFNLFEKTKINFYGSANINKSELWNNFNEITFKGQNTPLDAKNVNFNYFEIETETKPNIQFYPGNNYLIYGFNLTLLNKEKWTQIYNNDFIQLPYLSWWNPLAIVVNPITYLINFLIQKTGIGVLSQFAEALKSSYDFLYQNEWMFAWNAVFGAFLYGLITMRMIRGTINQFG